METERPLLLGALSVSTCSFGLFRAGFAGWLVACSAPRQHFENAATALRSATSACPPHLEGNS